MFYPAECYDQLDGQELGPFHSWDERGDADLEYDLLDPSIPAYRQ
jgi:hypothetical protein